MFHLGNGSAQKARTEFTEASGGIGGEKAAVGNRCIRERGRDAKALGYLRGGHFGGVDDAEARTFRGVGVRSCAREQDCIAAVSFPDSWAHKVSAL